MATVPAVVRFDEKMVVDACRDILAHVWGNPPGLTFRGRLEKGDGGGVAVVVEIARKRVRNATKRAAP